MARASAAWLKVSMLSCVLSTTLGGEGPSLQRLFSLPQPPHRTLSRMGIVTSGQDHSAVQSKVRPVLVNRSYSFRGEGLRLSHRRKRLSGKRPPPLGVEGPGQGDSGLRWGGPRLSVEGRKEPVRPPVPTQDRAEQAAVAPGQHCVARTDHLSSAVPCLRASPLEITPFRRVAPWHQFQLLRVLRQSCHLYPKRSISWVGHGDS